MGILDSLKNMRIVRLGDAGVSPFEKIQEPLSFQGIDESTLQKIGADYIARVKALIKQTGLDLYSNPKMLFDVVMNSSYDAGKSVVFIDMEIRFTRRRTITPVVLANFAYDAAAAGDAYILSQNNLTKVTADALAPAELFLTEDQRDAFMDTLWEIRDRLIELGELESINYTGDSNSFSALDAYIYHIFESLNPVNYRFIKR